MSLTLSGSSHSYFYCCEKTQWPKQIKQEVVFGTYGFRGSEYMVVIEESWQQVGRHGAGVTS